MKRFIFFWLFTYCCAVSAFAQPTADTGILYVLDGKLTDWNPAKFAVDNNSRIRYAMDNDGKYLYIGLQIPDIAMQMKMMRTGMSVYIDPKGKKKTGHSIQFPVVQEAGAAGFGTPGSGQLIARGEEETPDPATIRAKRLLMRNMTANANLYSIRVTGFGKEVDQQQALDVPGSIRVAYKCDTSEFMGIEYAIPLSLLGTIASLSNKQISIGCKIDAMKMPSGASMGGGSGMSGGGMGGRGGMRGGGGRMGGAYGGNRGSTNSSGMNRDALMKEQLFWATYTFTGI